MPKINVYLPDDLAASVKEAKLPVSAICQTALEFAVRDVAAVRASDNPPNADRPTGLFTRFTPRARQAILHAEATAREIPHNYVGTEHVLLGLLNDPENLGYKVLQSLEIEPQDLADELRGSMLPATERLEGHIPFTPLAKTALEKTTKEALSFGHNYMGCEHMLLGLLDTEDGLASQVMRRMGLEIRTTRRAVSSVLTGVIHARTQHLPSSSTSTPSSTVDPAKLDEILRRLEAIEQRLAG